MNTRHLQHAKYFGRQDKDNVSTGIRSLKSVLLFLSLLVLMALPNFSPAQTIAIDLKSAGLHPVHAGLESWGGVSPKEGELRANNYFFELNGRPFPIVTGEFHIQRYPAEYWEEAIMEMQAAGLNTISVYIFWSQVEPRPGEFDFTGHNDVRRFAGLCRKHGMHLILRVGPFCNAEFLLGGLPPWLYGQPALERSNDPAYLKLVGRYYTALGAQVKDLLWKNGGPIIAVQVENELASAPNGWDMLFRDGATTENRGPAGPEFTRHYQLLQALARQSGLEVPFYSVTAWGMGGKYPLPVDRVFPTYGGYMYLSPPKPGAGNSPLTVFGKNDDKYLGKVPIGFCELGAGTPVRAGYRSMPPVESSLATAFSQFGSLESLMVGYYMFHGGSNPYDATFGWTTKGLGFPLISYDYWSPIGEFGQWRASLRLLRPFNLFVQQFGAELAPTECRWPENPVTQADDDRLRVVARANGNTAFLFLLNYGNAHPLPARTNLQFAVATAAGGVRLPATGSINLPSPAFGILPVHLGLGGGMDLVSATVQPLCRVSYHGATWIFFKQLETGVRCELALAAASVKSIEPAGAGVTALTSDNPAIRVFEAAPSRGRSLRCTAPDGTVANLVVLSDADAQNLACIPRAKGSPLLVISDRKAIWTGAALKLYGPGEPAFAAAVFPPLAAKPAVKDAALTTAPDGVFTRITATVPARTVTLTVDRKSDSRIVLTLPAAAWQGLNDIYTDVSYVGDLCRVFNIRTGLLVADNFNNGQPWQLGLKRFRHELATDGLYLRIEPVLAKAKAEGSSDGMLLDVSQLAVGAAPKLVGLEVRPEYQVELPLP